MGVGLCALSCDQKSLNLQYDTLGCLEDGANKLSTKSPMFHVLFFLTFYKLRALKTLYFCNFINKMRKKIEMISAKNFARNHEIIILGTSDAWSTIR